MSERVIKLTVAYDGTDFVGWQRQKNGRTVQGLLEKALHQILGGKISVTAAGRTDSGVHAEGQVAHFKAPPKHPLPVLLKALNANLPEDIIILSLFYASPDFHARYSAKKKWYRYVVWNRKLRPLFDRRRMVHVPLFLDVKKMRQAARLMKGRHDFKLFHSSGRRMESTVRTIYQLRMTQDKGRIIMDIQADGFLYHMARRIAGFLIEVGRGKATCGHVKDILQGSSAFGPPTAPAHGLCLMRIWY